MPSNIKFKISGGIQGASQNSNTSPKCAYVSARRRPRCFHRNKRHANERDSQTHQPRETTSNQLSVGVFWSLGLGTQRLGTGVCGRRVSKFWHVGARNRRTLVALSGATSCNPHPPGEHASAERRRVALEVLQLPWQLWVKLFACHPDEHFACHVGGATPHTVAPSLNPPQRTHSCMHQKQLQALINSCPSPDPCEVCLA